MNHPLFAKIRSVCRWPQACLLGMLLLVPFLWAGCQTPPVDSPKDDQIILREGDVLSISFPGSTNLDTVQTIRRDGKISLPLVGEVHAVDYTPDELQDKLIKLFEKYFGWIAPNHTEKIRIAPNGNYGSSQTLHKPISQTHCILGNTAYPAKHPKRYGLLLLNNLLGGMGMSSRLNLEIREKHGIAYTIESNYTTFSDTGIFSIYFGTDAEKTAKAMRLVQKELKKLREQRLGTLQLQQAKQKFIGQIALAEENRMSLIIGMAKSLLDFGHVDSLEQVFAKINAVSADEMLEISNEIFDDAKMITLLFEPKE